MKLVHTGIFLSDDEMIELTTSTLDPMASVWGPSKRKEPWEVLQEIAKRHNLPPRDDFYGMTNEREIVYRKS